MDVGIILLFMTEAWRVPFARFLNEHCAVERSRARRYVYWVGRFLSSARPGEGTSMSASRFLDEMVRSEEPEHVEQAEEAIRLYAFFQERSRTEPASMTSNTTAPAWHAMAREMTRVARLKHLSLRTEKSYMDWLERFRIFAGEPSPAALRPRHVEQFLSHLAVEKKVAASTQN